MATRNFTFRMTGEGATQVINDLKSVATELDAAERALTALTQASPQLASVSDGVQVKLRETATALKDVGSSADKAATAHHGYGIAANTSSLAAYDMVKALSEISSGMPISMVATQHAGQAMYLYGDKLAAAKDGAVAFAKSLSTTTLILGGGALVGVTAITAAMVAFGVSAEHSQARLAQMATALRATRTDYAAMAKEATAAAQAIAATTGFGSANASAAARTIAGAPDFAGSTKQLEALIRTAGDLAAVMGQTLPQAAKQLATAMMDPGTEAKKLAKADFPGMTAALAAAIEKQQKAGDTAGAFARVLDVLHAQIDGAANASKTHLQLALDDLGKAFSSPVDGGKSLGDVLGNTVVSAATDAVQAITGLVNTVNWARDHLPQGVSNGVAHGLLDAIPGGAALDALWRGKQLYNHLTGGAQAQTAVLYNQPAGPPAPGVDANGITNLPAVTVTATKDYSAALTKLHDQVAAQIASQDALTKAYGLGYDAVQKALAQQTAEKELITKGLKPGTDAYTAALTKATAAQEKLAASKANTYLAKQIADNKDALAYLKAETDSLGMNNDARAIMLKHLKAEQELKKRGVSLDSAMAKADLASTDAITKQGLAFQQTQSSVKALTSGLSGVFDTLGQSISNAFVGGSGSAVNFGNILHSLEGSIGSLLIKLGAVDPIGDALSNFSEWNVCQ